MMDEQRTNASPKNRHIEDVLGGTHAASAERS